MGRGPLLAWQLSLYPANHTARRTLVVHALTVPLFHAGALCVLAAPWLGAWSLAALPLLAAPIAVQGAAHRREPVAPVPFDGPLDFVKRITAEQLVTFPRFVLSGGFAEAWRRSG